MFIIQKVYNNQIAYLSGDTYRDGALILRMRWSVEQRYAKQYKTRSGAIRAAARWGGTIVELPGS